MKRGARARSRGPALPGGAVLRTLGDETQWSVLSRGERIHGRTWGAARGTPAPVAILCSPDGSAGHELVARARSAWAGRAALAAFDLVLCGARRSDKLSEQAFDPRDPLAARLRADLEAQTAADLAAVVALLRSDPALDPQRVSLVAVGRGARLARSFATAQPDLHAFVLEEEASQGDAWLRSLAARLAAQSAPG